MPSVKTAKETRRIILIRNAHVYDFGGGERFPVDLASELAEAGYRPVVVSRSPKLLAYAGSKQIPTVRGWWWSRQDWSGRRALLFPVYLGWQLALTVWYLQLIIRLQPDVVHPQSKDDFIAASLAAACLGKRVIWTDHADLKYVYANNRVWYKNPVGKLVRLASRRARAICLVSLSEQRLVASALGAGQLPANYLVVHNGVKDRHVEPAARSSHDQPAFVYCATSRLVAAKGIGELLQAYAKLRAQHDDVRLWLAGDGPEAKRFRAQAAAIPDVTFLGHLDDPLPQVAAADVFVHPSYHEGFSISLVEAAMLAKPIIACNVGGNPEIVSHQQTGLLVPAKDSNALLDAMRQLYKDRALSQQLGTNARQRYASDFEFGAIVRERIVPLYEN